MTMAASLARSLDDLIRRLSSSVFRNNTDRFLLLDGAFGRADLVTADHSAGQVWFRIKKCSPLEDHTFSLFLILRQPFIFGGVHAFCALSDREHLRPSPYELCGCGVCVMITRDREGTIPSTGASRLVMGRF